MALFFMRKLALAALPFVLIGCGSPTVEVTEQPDYPVYCIRDVIFLDDDPQGRLLLDMPGYPYGQTDMMQEIDRQTYNEMTHIDACKSDDPRMNLEPRGIDWTDGRKTDLDGNPLNE